MGTYRNVAQIQNVLLELLQCGILINEAIQDQLLEIGGQLVEQWKMRESEHLSSCALGIKGKTVILNRTILLTSGFAK